MNKLIGERIKARRKQLELTQADLAFESDTSQGAISRYELGINEPTADAIITLALALNCSTDYLLGLTDIPYREVSENELPEDERLLLQLYREKSKEARQRIVEVAKVI